MLRLAILFLVISLVAAFLGFGGVANLSFDAARLVFGVFLVLAIVFAITGFVRGSPRNIV